MIKNTLIAAVAVTTLASAANARDQISIVGSSTVFPFATVVAENFGRTTSFKTPVIESTGSGGGLKLFCAGVGTNTPDITNASRKIKDKEVKLCAKNGVTPIEYVIGYDGIVIANAKDAPSFSVTPREVFLALAAKTPRTGYGDWGPNEYKTWNEINPSLPATSIEVLGPPPTSGTRDAFVELVMEKGCKTFEWANEVKKKQGKKAFKELCHRMREDGAWIDAGENDNLIVQKLTANPNALGVFGFSFLEENSNAIKGAKVNGVAPTFDTIADGSYPVSRSLQYYVKKEHIGQIAGIEEYVAMFEEMQKADGPLSERGLIPLQ